jgi:hypothetical protein
MMRGVGGQRELRGEIRLMKRKGKLEMMVGSRRERERLRMTSRTYQTRGWRDRARSLP